MLVGAFARSHEGEWCEEVLLQLVVCVRFFGVASIPIGSANATPVYNAFLSVVDETLESNASWSGSYAESKVTVGDGVTRYEYTINAQGPLIMQRSFGPSAFPDDVVVINSIVIQTGDIIADNIISMSPGGTLGQWQQVDLLTGILFENLFCTQCVLTIETNTLPMFGTLMAEGSNAFGDVGFLFAAGIGSPALGSIDDPPPFGYMYVPGMEPNMRTGVSVSLPSTLALLLLGVVFLRRRRKK